MHLWIVDIRRIEQRGNKFGKIIFQTEKTILERASQEFQIDWTEINSLNRFQVNKWIWINEN